MIFPFKPTQDTSFTVNFYNDYSSESYSFAVSASNPWTIFSISKDGGTFVPTVNSPTYVPSQVSGDSHLATVGFSQLVLTDEEMNASIIIVAVQRVSSGTVQAYAEMIIYTVPTQPTTLDTTVENINGISSINPTLQEVLSLIWIGMTKKTNKKGQDFKTWLKEFDF